MPSAAFPARLPFISEGQWGFHLCSFLLSPPSHPLPALWSPPHKKKRCRISSLEHAGSRLPSRPCQAPGPQPGAAECRRVMCSCLPVPAEFTRGRAQGRTGHTSISCPPPVLQFPFPPSPLQVCPFLVPEDFTARQRLNAFIYVGHAGGIFLLWRNLNR